MPLTPSLVFDHFLRQLQKVYKPQQIYVKSLHLAFYQVSLDKPEEMAKFEFLLRTEPYSPTINDLIWEFWTANHILRPTASASYYEFRSGDYRKLEAAEEDINSLQEVVDLLIKKMVG